MSHEGWPAGMSQPALRALAGAEIGDLAELSRRRRRDVAGLHGMGPKGIRLLTEALVAEGLDWAG